VVTGGRPASPLVMSLGKALNGIASTFWVVRLNSNVAAWFKDWNGHSLSPGRGTLTNKWVSKPKLC